MLDICFNLNSELETKGLFISLLVKETIQINRKFREKKGVLIKPIPSQTKHIWKPLNLALYVVEKS